ncbi:TrmH family RNA methyltransferase [Oceanispirochaeta sp.]|jgi:TrmH family RNA methyltransferase|uniref:TrmH family RNA methyltransferase n=1 Tax=Oceanispirochaeta sp. TaxID=2035350 RepID=UPI00260CEB37|nr:TrmH family RNA methyltransferase [Oceanispirochaeta sp.]MDA3957153.1 TrmH family RNA methyltransferase [Oceanispirochaeta sp.]
MITVRKLFSLKDGTRERKIIKILGEWERELSEGVLPDSLYLKEFFRALTQEQTLSSYGDLGTDLSVGSEDPLFLRRKINHIRHELIKALGVSPAEWDLIHRPDLSGAERKIFPCKIYLDEIRSPFNVGSIFRTAECFGVSEILLSAGTADPGHLRASRTSMGCTERIPWRRVEIEELRNLNEPVFAMELGGVELDQFIFPEQGLLILGSEELGVSPECLALAEKSRGVVTIPLYGNKTSLNVSVSFGIIMNDWSGEFLLA